MLKKGAIIAPFLVFVFTPSNLCASESTMPDSATLLWGLLFGSIGFGYFIYGKRQTNPVARYTGIALMLYPYLVSNVTGLVLIGLALMSLPYFIKT